MTPISKRKAPLSFAALSSLSLLACLSLASPVLAGDAPTTQAHAAQSAARSAAAAADHDDLFADLAAVEDTQLESHKAGGHGGGAVGAVCCGLGCLIVLLILIAIG